MKPLLHPFTLGRTLGQRKSLRQWLARKPAPPVRRTITVPASLPKPESVDAHPG